MSADSDQGSKPWHDVEKLNELYHGEGMSLSEMADEFGCTSATIRYHMDKAGIERRTRDGGDHEDRPWADKETLEELYVEKGLSSYEIGEELGCCHTTVLDNLEKCNIEKRDSYQSGGPSVRFQMGPHNYEKIRHLVDGVDRTISVHRLVAVAEFGLEAIKDMHIHHKNGVKWDNRHENLEIISPEDHARLHIDQGDMGGGREKVYSEDDLIEWIDAFVEEFGVVPSSSDIVGWPGPSPGVYLDRFGSFTKAVRAAGYTPRSERGGSDD